MSGDVDPHAQYWVQMQQAIVQPGGDGAELRDAVLEHAASSSVTSALPGEVLQFIDKVITEAEAITQDDFARLHQAGHSDDDAFELVVAAAIGAGTRRLRAGLALLEAEAP